MSDKDRTFRILSLDCFLFLAALGVYPFVPIYYRGYGVTDVQIGIIAATSAMVGVFATSAWGSFSDGVGRRKPFIALGCAALASTMIAYTLVSSFETFLIVAVLGALLAPSSIALLAASVFELARSEAKATTYARYRICGSVGWIITTSFLGMLISAYGIKAAFYLSATLFLCAMLNSLRIVESKKRQTLGARRSAVAPIKELVKEHKLLVFLVILSLLFITFSMNSVFLPLYLKFLGASPELISITFAVPAIFEIPIMLYAGRLSDKIGRNPLLALSSSLTSLRFFLCAMTLNPFLILPINSLHAFGYGLADVTSTTLISDTLPLGKQGIGQTLYASGVLSVADIMGPLVGGIISGMLGLRVMFYVASLLAMASTMLFAVSIKKKMVR
jgi:PPP family 3-phenylpropionic acid transporter